jgi:hypothetical protein
MKLRVREVFYRYLCWTFSTIDEFIAKGQFHRLRVFQIQPILKYYKANGHPKISAYQNKADLVKTLTEVLQQELAYESTLSEAENPKSDTPSDYLNELLAFADHPDEEEEEEEEEDEEEKEEEKQEQQERAEEGKKEEKGITLQVATPTIVPHQSILLNPYNQRVFTELQMSSFTSVQIIEAINENYTASDSLIDYDLLMLAILSKVEVIDPLTMVTMMRSVGSYPSTNL